MGFVLQVAVPAQAAPDPGDKRLADQGNASAQVRVGIAYVKERNYSEAARYYKLAADQGQPEAQTRLANLKCHGMGVAKDVPECIRLYQLAAAGGDIDAQTSLGMRYLMADGIAANYDEAVRLGKLTSGKGNANGQVLLAMCYEFGAGVPKNIDEALRLYKLAAAQGHVGGQNSVNRLAGKAKSPSPTVSVSTMTVQLRRVAGIFVVPTVLNEAVNADFVVDSGAGLVAVPENIVQALRNSGKLADSDFTGVQKFKIANGAIIESKTFVLRSMSINGRFLPSIRAGVVPTGSAPLLGQSFLERFHSWAIDNERHVLLLREKDVTR